MVYGTVSSAVQSRYTIPRSNLLRQSTTSSHRLPVKRSIVIFRESADYKNTSIYGTTRQIGSNHISFISSPTTAMFIHCLRCRRKTPTVNMTETTVKGNRRQVRGECAACHSRKSTFVSAVTKRPAA